ncbi:MAG: hypothetical protein ABMB14_30410 [Myxococcota bacterium]
MSPGWPGAVTLALALTPVADAHRPLDGGTETEISDPTISWFVEGELTPGAVHEIHLELPRDFALPFELMVPHQSRYADWRPAYAVVGPGLPPPTDAERAALPRAIPDGEGAYVDLNDDPEREVYFEDVLRRTYWSSGTIALPLRAGDNHVWVWDPRGGEGPYGVGFGVEEDFGFGGGGDR